jgi:hypothetical protein
MPDLNNKKHFSSKNKFNNFFVKQTPSTTKKLYKWVLNFIFFKLLVFLFLRINN